MEIFSTFSSNSDFPFLSFLLALTITLFCCFISLFPFRLLKSSQSDKPKACDCDSTCSNFDGDAQSMAVTASVMNGGEVFLVERERRQMIGASMMEQLVPEITTHALSYLDYPSLCRLSMTNSSMRRAANDDNAWKALYHKDFTMEQDSITPSNGWKAYYASTRAIINSNQQFFNIIRERSLLEMGRLWLNADYVKCVHLSGELFTGYNGVIGSWQLAFNWEPGFDFQVRDVRARVLTDMAWVTMRAAVGMDDNPLNVSNVFEFHNGRWYMVHHHSSVSTKNI
ncbi:F-box domain, cyclin-like protein [Cynara cardunculus var. scolymus]|uniref:F-box domain, cyclin-like protein n=1 Tax=Cynara cardunculus var. scolymus TaxID=59895 RepID=A0A118JV10_CYNCS|nr:F-box domain, cyclin-like protein [Cynara cardunculus var. scolymus]